MAARAKAARAKFKKVFLRKRTSRRSQEGHQEAIQKGFLRNTTSFILNMNLTCRQLKLKRNQIKGKKEGLFMLILNTNKKAVRAKSKSKKTELR